MVHPNAEMEGSVHSRWIQRKGAGYQSAQQQLGLLCHCDDWDLGSASQGLHCGEPTHGYPWLSLVFSAADTLSYHDPVDSVLTLAN